MTRILIVDDFKMARDFYAYVLRSAGYDVLEAFDGTDSIEKLYRNDDIACIVTDINVPNMDGFQLIERVRKDFKDVYPYIFVITSLDSDDDVLKAFDLGTDEVLIKPIDPKRLVAAVLCSLNKLKMITFDMLVNFLVNMMNFRDKYTGNHAKDVKLLSTLIARAYSEEFDLDERFVENVSTAALLHDMGKILVPEQSLQKPDKLSKQEFEIVKENTTKGNAILQQSLQTHPENDTLKTIYEVVRHHHENRDGTGYPDGLKGEGIPLPARIVRVADVFDTLTSDRYYRKAYPPVQALEIMKSFENHSDPQILKILLEHHRFFLSIARSKF